MSDEGVPHQRWTVGSATITKIEEVGGMGPNGGPESGLPDAWPEEIVKIPWLIPDFANEAGHLAMSVHSLLVDSGGQRIIVDTCIGNDKVRTIPHFDHLSTDFLENVTQAGWGPETVDAVICTHLHVDHVGWNTMWRDDRWVPTFPNARYYMVRTEVDHVTAQSQQTDFQPSSYAAAMIDVHNVYGDSVRPILDAGLSVLVDSDAQLFPGVRLIPTPGHTPGHVSVLIESGQETAVISGDMMHHPCQIAHPEWCSAFDDDPSLSIETRFAFLERFADTRTLLIGTHFGGPSAGRVVRAGAGFRLVSG
jgi:glyoxylase-like metal-dependent hydrolase (beta-lactamase superfamily II)